MTSRRAGSSVRTAAVVSLSILGFVSLATLSVLPGCQTQDDILYAKYTAAAPSQAVKPASSPSMSSGGGGYHPYMYTYWTGVQGNPQDSLAGTVRSPGPSGPGAAVQPTTGTLNNGPYLGGRGTVVP